jgi:hypothetical protein
MSPKLPAKGTLKDNTPTRLPDAPGTSRRAGSSSHPDVDLSTMNLGGTASGAHQDGDAQRNVAISRIAPSTYTDLPTEQGALHDFWIPGEVTLPAPDPRGLRTHKGRHYVVLPDGHAVQVALDPQSGFYRARRAGERNHSGPWLVRDRDNNHWKPLEDSPEALRIRSTADLELEIDRLANVLDESSNRLKELKQDWRASRGKEQERSAIVGYEVHSHKHLAAVEKMVEFYATEQRSLVISHGARIYKKDWLNMNKALLKIHSKIATISQARWRLSVPAHTVLTEEHHRTTATHLKNRLALLRKSQVVADEVQRISPEPKAVFAEVEYYPMEIHELTASWVIAKSQTLSAIHFAYIPQILSMSFSRLVGAFSHVDSIPIEARLPALSHLTAECGLIKTSYETLDMARNPVHATAREEIVNVIKNFEITLEDRFAFYYRNLQSASSIPPLEMVIDFDFPAERRLGRPPQTLKMFRSFDDRDDICIGQIRHTAEGQQLIDVMDPGNPEIVLQTYERRNGEWRHLQTTANKPLASLTFEARQLLETTDQYLRRAHHAGVVEEPHYDYRQLDDLRLEIEHTSNPATDETALLAQRLRQTSQRLLKAGEEARSHRYKNQSFLSAERVAFLIRHDHLRVSQAHNRLALGAGQQKEFLDVYSLDDKLTGRPLWKAHFRYERTDSPVLDFKPHGGHLETLEHAAAGAFLQRRDEQPERPLNELWRLTLDRHTAQKIFDLAS